MGITVTSLISGGNINNMAEQIQSPESSSCRTMTASAEWTNKYFTFTVIFRENNQIQLCDVYIFDSKYERMRAALARHVSVCLRYETCSYCMHFRFRHFAKCHTECVEISL